MGSMSPRSDRDGSSVERIKVAEADVINTGDAVSRRHDMPFLDERLPGRWVRLQLGMIHPQCHCRSNHRKLFGDLLQRLNSKSTPSCRVSLLPVDCLGRYPWGVSESPV